MEQHAVQYLVMANRQFEWFVRVYPDGRLCLFSERDGPSWAKGPAEQQEPITLQECEERYGKAVRDQVAEAQEAFAAGRQPEGMLVRPRPVLPRVPRRAKPKAQQRKTYRPGGYT